MDYPYRQSGGESKAGGKLKEAGTLNWASPNTGATNETGFSALPGGLRGDNGSFLSLGDFGYWWTATEVDTGRAWYRGMSYYGGGVSRSNYYKALGFSVRCVRDNVPTLSSTTEASAITTNTAASGGEITNDGGVTITARGICWSTSAAPTTALSTKTTETGTIGAFSSSMNNLTANTKYYVRAYATNSAVTAYGAEVSFTTQAAPVGISDIDGNVYTSVTIGTQTWMVENLKTTKYRDGSSIANVTDGTFWAGLSTGAWCDYSNLAANGTKYGHLYNWYAAADSRNIAPVGWHVPTDAEWTTLTAYLGGESVAGGKLKEAGTLNWASPNTGTTNETGFSALPGGSRNGSGTFYNLGYFGNWWTATEYGAGSAWPRSMFCNLGDVSSYYGLKTNGFSVRCVRDSQ